MTKKTVLLLILMVLSVDLLAGGSVSYRKIDEVAFNTGGFFLYSSIGWSNPNECDQVNAVVLLEDAPNYDKAYALVLAAYMSGKEIVGYSNHCVEFDGKTYNMIRGHKYLRVR